MIYIYQRIISSSTFNMLGYVLHALLIFLFGNFLISVACILFIHFLFLKYNNQKHVCYLVHSSKTAD